MTTLDELGLSSYEEQAYRALVATGSATASTVADRSGVPDGRIYDVLNGLESRGLVRSQSGEPRRYGAVDPETAVDRLLDERLSELDARRERYRDLAAEARSTIGPTPPTAGNVWLADLGDADSTTLIGEQLAAATERFVMAAGPPYEAASVADYERELDAFVDGLEPGLSVDLLFGGPLADALSDRIDALRETAADVGVRRLDGIGVTFDVVDGSEAYVEVPHPFADGERFGFVEVRASAVAGELERAFDAAWERAEPVR